MVRTSLAIFATFVTCAVLTPLLACDSSSASDEPAEPDERIFTPAGEPWVAVIDGQRNENITVDVLDLGEDEIAFTRTQIDVHPIDDSSGNNEIEYHGELYASAETGGTITPPEVFTHTEDSEFTLHFDTGEKMRDRQDFPDTGRYSELHLDWEQVDAELMTTNLYEAEGEIFSTSLALKPLALLTEEYPLHADFEIDPNGEMTLLDIKLTEQGSATSFGRNQLWTGDWTFEDQEDFDIEVELATHATEDRLTLQVRATFDPSDFGLPNPSNEQFEIAGFVLTFAYNDAALGNNAEVLELAPLATELSYAISESGATLEMELWDISGDNSRYAEIQSIDNPFYPAGPERFYVLALITGADLVTGEIEDVRVYQNQTGNLSDTWTSFDGNEDLRFHSNDSFDVRDSNNNILIEGYWRSDGDTRVWYDEPQHYERP